MLVETKADVEAKDSDGTSVVHHASEGNPKCLQLLIDNGTDVNARGFGIKRQQLNVVTLAACPVCSCSCTTKQTSTCEMMAERMLCTNPSRIALLI
jgi:hypothetical protein